ncbi:hypothetical protein BraRD5C2_39890 [Bradyrhizobium sp. RD5-C2]|nr:hypothetical protein BraRD5C2_39890 [Bradyrhizobium sp. RD5-C2]
MRVLITAGMIFQLAALEPALAQATGGANAGGGALGTSATSPGTNSAGTAAPSGRLGTGSSVATGTGDPKTDKQEREVNRKVKSICKGC